MPVEQRADYLVRIAGIIRQRKLEFDAWLVLEAGKTWAEAEADVSEAIDFCEYYARLALKLAKPEPLVQLIGERDEMVYMPLGVGVVIPPWNFPLAILVGMTVAALVTGNTVVHQAFERDADDCGEVRRSDARGGLTAESAFRC